METENKTEEKEEEVDAVELVLFQVSECYVYMIPPRISAASYRADEWNVNKWSWEGSLKVISKGVECIIRLEDNKTGELYARAFLRDGEPHPVEPVIDSSRYFVLRVEENIGGRLRHAFIGLGFRERTEAYDFQAALHDHMKYLNKKKVAEEMEQQYQQTSAVDYSLKDGETLVLQLNNPISGGSVKTKVLENSISVDDKGKNKEAAVLIKLPPPPAPESPVAAAVGKSFFEMKASESETSQLKIAEKDPSEMKASESETSQLKIPEEDPSPNIPDDSFGDFQAA